jgi:hypothetical protein
MPPVIKPTMEEALIVLAKAREWDALEYMMLFLEAGPGNWQCDDFAELGNDILKKAKIDHNVEVGYVRELSHVWIVINKEGRVLDPSRDQFGEPPPGVEEYHAETTTDYTAEK